MEKSSIEILTAFAKKNNLQYWKNTNYQHNLLVPGDPFISTKFFVMECISGQHTYYYCAYDSFSSKAYSGRCYSGIYRDFSHKETPDLKVRPKFWIDKLSFKRKIKMGSNELDKKLLIQSSDADFANKIVSQKLGLAFIKLYKLISPIDLIIDTNYLSYNTQLKGKSIIGIETNEWITENDQLNLLFDKGIDLLDLVKNR